jgi:hypothetical protein
MYVAPGNENMATEEMMAVVKKLHEMVEDHKMQKEAIIAFAEENGLWHLELECHDLSYYNVQDEHERWLASYHNC